MVAEIEQDLQKGWRLETVPHERGGKDSDTIYVKVSDSQALRFTVAPYGGLGSLVLAQTLSTLAVITFILLFVSTYAVRWITAPLTSIASAARAFGRPGGEAPETRRAGAAGDCAGGARAQRHAQARAQPRRRAHPHVGGCQPRPAHAADPAAASHRAPRRRPRQDGDAGGNRRHQRDADRDARLHARSRSERGERGHRPALAGANHRGAIRRRRAQCLLPRRRPPHARLPASRAHPRASPISSTTP